MKQKSGVNFKLICSLFFHLPSSCHNPSKNVLTSKRQIKECIATTWTNIEIPIKLILKQQKPLKRQKTSVGSIKFTCYPQNHILEFLMEFILILFQSVACSEFKKFCYVCKKNVVFKRCWWRRGGNVHNYA